MSGSRLLYSQAWLQAPRFSSTLIPLKSKSIAQDPEPQASSPKEQLHQRFGRAPRKPPTQAKGQGTEAEHPLLEGSQGLLEMG